MKTAEELNALKEEVEALNRKLSELSEEELKQVTGGVLPVPSQAGFVPTVGLTTSNIDWLGLG